MRKVLIYRNEVLPISETFIRAQAEALNKFEARFVGLKKVPEGLRPHLPPVLLTEDDSLLSKFERRLFRQAAIAPIWFRRLGREKPDLVHAHFALDGVLAMLLADELRVPLVVTLHGYDVTMTDEALAQMRDGPSYLKGRAKLWQKATKFLCSCEYIMNRAAAIGFPREKMEVLYSGHNLNAYLPAVKPRNRNLVLFVGRLIEKKGCSYLLRAVAKVAEVHPEVELAIVGAGPLLEPLQDLAKSLRINCRFLGKLMDPEPGNSVQDWMRSARVFCAPSVTASDGNTEGQPAVFVEAHALGLPAVSFQTAGIGEAVLHGETGLLAPEKDVDALAAHILRLLTDDALWQRFSERGLSWVRERFDIDLLTQQLERVYINTRQPAIAETVQLSSNREVQIV
jgi:colanic acid/amylovoran biosynthesis glycosyltransferase